MGSGGADEVEAALADHAAFERLEHGYRLKTVDFESDIRPRDDTLQVRVWLPTLAAVVTGEEVAAIVEKDWFETLRRRLLEGYDVAISEHTSDAEVVRQGDEITVTYEIDASSPSTAVDDAKALIEFAIGTYVQSAIPGYTYDAPLGDLLETALDRGQQPSG